VICNKIFYRTPSSSQVHAVGVTGNDGLERQGNYQGSNRERISLFRHSWSFTCDERLAGFPAGSNELVSGGLLATQEKYLDSVVS
jgi:hypothetical protein